MEIDLTLYAIADPICARGRRLDELVSSAIEGGATVVQLRDKRSAARRVVEEAKALCSVARRYGVPFIVNDRADIALASGADGVHLGQDDLPCSEAREILGSDRIIGLSVHSLDEAKDGQEQGADYVSVGKIYSSGTKVGGRVVGLSTLRDIVEGVHLPVVAVGGISLANLAGVFEAGASGVAVISALFEVENVRVRARAFREEIGRLAGQLRGTVN